MLVMIWAFKACGNELTSSSSEDISSMRVARSAPGALAILLSLSCSNRSVHLEHLFRSFPGEGRGMETRRKCRMSGTFWQKSNITP